MQDNTTTEGLALREAAARLEELGTLAAADAYRQLAAELDRYWQDDPAGAVAEAISYIEELASGTTDPRRREADHRDAIGQLLEAAADVGGFTEDELLEQAMGQAVASDRLDRALGIEPEDKPFPEPR